MTRLLVAALACGMVWGQRPNWLSYTVTSENYWYCVATLPGDCELQIVSSPRRIHPVKSAQDQESR